MIDFAYKILQEHFHSDSFADVTMFGKHKGLNYGAFTTSKHELKQLVRKVIDGSLCSSGSLFYLQKAGIAIGGVASKNIADLYCMSVEWRHMERLLCQEARRLPVHRQVRRR